MEKPTIAEIGVTVLCVSTGILVLSLVPAALGIRQTQKATAFNLMADGHRMISLSKQYDAKAAAMAIKTVVKEIL